VRLISHAIEEDTLRTFFRFASTLVLLAGLLGSLGLRPLLPARAQSTPDIGAIWTTALDSAGNGWAWAGPKPQTFATSFLIRIENGAWTVSADTNSNPSLLPPGLHILRMTVTANGQEGWAIGGIESDEYFLPVLWRLENGTWTVRKHSLAPAVEFIDLAVSADGSDGWLTIYDNTAEEYKLLRLRNGAWDFVATPPDGALVAVALSPDGRQGWAVGPSSQGEDGASRLMRLVDGRWTGAPGTGVGALQIPVQVVADNAGNGWLITVVGYEMTAHSRRAAPATQTSNIDMLGQLFRLTPGAPPREIEIALAPRDPEAGGEFYLNGVAVDGAGQGWAVGVIDYGLQEAPPDSEDEEAWLYQPVTVRLRGEEAAVVPAETVGFFADDSQDPSTVAVSPEGAHSWVGYSDGYDYGALHELPQPWPYTQPAAAAPLPGAGRCFAAVPYCLRGVFAAYWAKNGGLDQFGYPITPEIQEQQGDQTYTVQYTERARFEYHPENTPPYDVLLGLLGNTLVEGRLAEDPFKAIDGSGLPNTQWFKETGHNVGPPFLGYWQGHGGLPVFGLPRSEAFDETNAADGKTYRVQYFERNRIEYHPENQGTKFEFLLGLLGVEQFTQTYAYTP
jgi:hypothetical protein